MALTTIGIANRRPKKADYRVTDGGGLYIPVRPNRSKLWRYDYQLGGSRCTHSIGEFGHLYVEDAKAQHLVARLNTFETAGSYETRSRLQSTAINIMGWAHGQAWIEHNPFVGFSFGKGSTSHARRSSRPRPSASSCATSLPIRGVKATWSQNIRLGRER